MEMDTTAISVLLRYHERPVTQRCTQCSRIGGFGSRYVWRGRRLRNVAVRVVVSVLGLTAMLAAPTTAVAHPVPFSYLDLRMQPATIEGSLVVHVFDAGHDLQVDADSLLVPEVAARYGEALAALLGPRFSVAADGRILTPKWLGIDPLPDGQSLRLRFSLALGATAAPAVPGASTAAPSSIAVTARLFPYDPQHQTFLNVYDGERLTQAILGGPRDRFEYIPATHQGPFDVMKRFVPLGMHHILIGPDHLLFLFGLLLLGGTMRRLAMVVTAFTIAHSLTLSLAVLNLVTPPARVIEPAIALSIIYVGADNLLVRNGRDMRVWVAFGFGFIHGFGFATVLREMDLPGHALGWSLFSFNVGVEIGQLLVVITVASALGWLRARSEAAGRHLVFAGSIVVIAAGAFWFVQRVFFPGGIS
jgi:hydrogenase/urease accessory protein HupE